MNKTYYLPKFTKFPIQIGELIELSKNNIDINKAQHVTSMQTFNGRKGFTAEIITSHAINAVPVNSIDNIYLIYNGEHS